MSYSIPKGVQRGLEVDLSDQTYDGREEGDRLVGGLGQLVDGQKGTDNFRSDIHGYGKGEVFFLYIHFLFNDSNIVLVNSIKENWKSFFFKFGREVFFCVVGSCT